MVIDCALGREPDLTPKRVPAPAQVRFIFTQRDLDDYEAVRERAPETIWRCSVCGAQALADAVTDSSNRHGWWITAGVPLPGKTERI